MGLQTGRKGPIRPKSPFGAIRRSGVSQVVEQSRHIPGDAMEPFLRSGGPLRGANRTPNGPQMIILEP